jgi:hypothetical protein
MNLERIGLHVPTILLPRPGIDLTRWAVIACDQYTSQPEYWETVKQLVGDSPSTLHLIFPEIHLESADKEERIRTIRETMRQYVTDGTLVPQRPGFILVDRQTCQAKSRKGLVVALDLEQYDYGEGATTLIRATEGTILERLPPRIKVRESADIEIPHIMVLIDDPEKTVIEPLFDQPLEQIYDAPLMMNGGRVRGYRIDDGDQIASIARAIGRLAGLDVAGEQEMAPQRDVFLYAMGDGNHSFATAKVIWEKLKAAADDKDAIMNHPARYALVELVNLYDEGLEFEAIHRVVFRVAPESLLQGMEQFFRAQGMTCTFQYCDTLGEAKDIAGKQDRQRRHAIPFIGEARHGVALIEDPRFELAVASLQGFLDAFRKSDPSAEIDYVHGEGAVTELSSKPQTTGFLLPALSKYQLFKSIAKDGALPRKTFSMGEADEKRFYFECRKITT